MGDHLRLAERVDPDVQVGAAARKMTTARGLPAGRLQCGEQMVVAQHDLPIVLAAAGETQDDRGLGMALDYEPQAILCADLQ